MKLALLGMILIAVFGSAADSPGWAGPLAGLIALIGGVLMAIGLKRNYCKICEAEIPAKQKLCRECEAIVTRRTQELARIRVSK
jgi:predicted nucleic acid-binding Zn ribbon protein